MFIEVDTVLELAVCLTGYRTSAALFSRHL